MKIYKVLLTAIIAVLVSCSGSGPKKVLSEKLKEYQDSYSNENYIKMSSYMVPSIIEASGGTEAFVTIMKQTFETLKQQGTDMSKMIFDQPSDIVEVDGLMVSVVETHMPITSSGLKGMLNSSIIAFSEDGGDVWYFMDGGNDGASTLAGSSPEILQKITIPNSTMELKNGEEIIKMVQKNGQWIKL